MTYMHPLAQAFCEDTYGIIVYQEQVMTCGRVIGNLSWEDVSELRKAMSKSLGEEFFNKYWIRFEEGAREKHAIPTAEARRIWDKMCTFGSWAFNKSHAVSYGLVSYWCAVLKAHHPLEFAAASLRNAKDEEQSVRILRDLQQEGYKFSPVDRERSTETWAVVDGELLGGLTNIKGIGAVSARNILRRRREGLPLQPGQAKLLANAVTPFDNIFETRKKFADYFAHPEKHGIESARLTEIKDIGDPGEYIFIAKIHEKKLRDLNEYSHLVKRGGRVIKASSLFLNLVLADDTGTIIGRIDRFSYKELGKPIIESGKIGDYYIWKGRIDGSGWRMMDISRWRKL